jgi:hypothetical protein
MRVNVVFLALLLVGCVDYSGKWVAFGTNDHAIQRTFPLFVSACNVTDHDVQIIYDAVVWWNNVVGEEILLPSPGGCDDHRYMDLQFSFMDVQDADASRMFTGGCEDNICAEAWAVIYPKWYTQPNWFKPTIIRHEIGHYLGLGHDYLKGCVMYPGAPQAQEGLCKEEHSELCKHYPELPNCHN